MTSATLDRTPADTGRDLPGALFAGPLIRRLQYAVRFYDSRLPVVIETPDGVLHHLPRKGAVDVDIVAKRIDDRGHTRPEMVVIVRTKD